MAPSSKPMYATCYADRDHYPVFLDAYKAIVEQDGKYLAKYFEDDGQIVLAYDDGVEIRGNISNVIGTLSSLSICGTATYGDSPITVHERYADFDGIESDDSLLRAIVDAVELVHQAVKDRTGR